MQGSLNRRSYYAQFTNKFEKDLPFVVLDKKPPKEKY